MCLPDDESVAPNGAERFFSSTLPPIELLKDGTDDDEGDGGGAVCSCCLEVCVDRDADEEDKRRGLTCIHSGTDERSLESLVATISSSSPTNRAVSSFPPPAAEAALASSVPAW